MLVAAEARDLGDALDALIGNVFSHTDEGVSFRVAVGVTDARAGLARGHRRRARHPARTTCVERGQSDSGSTGLGLDIARRLAERSGGSIEIGSGASGGARVRLNLTRAPNRRT